MNADVKLDLTLIGIGSSAGGLEAIRELVATLPDLAPVSYVVVQHMSPHHKSLMTELVSRQTSLEVHDVEDGIVPRENVVYITPPNHDVIYNNGKLHLIAPSPELAAPKPSVDRFLQSLADAHGENTMAIILSGTGSDGAYGVQAIREAGGITIAQDTETAKYDGMPRAAVQTGCVDLILSPQDIGTHLQKILASQRNFDDFRQDGARHSPNGDLLQILLARTRMDFRDYKQSTISRRIERRMLALGIDSLEDYTQFLRTNPQAVDALFKDLLISVTRFFRDRKEFDQLRDLLPALLRTKPEGEPLRVWVAGCATGEEAYSIAILLAEAFGGPEVKLKNHVQIFATDIDSAALGVARRGVYSAGALDDIPADLSETYLIQQTDGIRVIETIRSAILFSEHNVCQDPPFQKIDLLCCRNVLIYFGNTLQQKVMSRFHYAMSPHALLFLGTAETVGVAEQLFTADTPTARIYRKRSVLSTPSRAFLANRSDAGLSRARTISAPGAPQKSTDRLLFEALAQSLGPNSVLVTEDYSIARIFGNVSDYVQMTSETALRMHLDLLRSPLREEARSLVTIAFKNGEKRSGVRHILSDDGKDVVRLEVYPIIANAINERVALVTFTKLAPQQTPAIPDVSPVEDEALAARMRTLEHELAGTREALQQTIEELETSNEELQSLNEELQSTNEELQATNEELETSNEELQSTNEELITVNEELHVTTSELHERSGELTSVLENAPLPILVMDTALQVTQSTNLALDRFQLMRPLTHPHISQCRIPQGFPALAPLCSETLRLGQAVHRRFVTEHAQTILTCAPYFDKQGQMLGVTLVVNEYPTLLEEMEAILETSQILFVHRMRDGTVLRVGRKTAELLGLVPEEMVGKKLSDLLPASAAALLMEDTKQVLEAEGPLPPLELALPLAGREGPLHLSMDRFRYHPDGAQEATVISVAVDVTETKRAQHKAENLLRQLQLLQEFANVGYFSFGVRDSHPHWSSEVFRIHGVDPAAGPPLIEDAINFYHPDDRASVAEAVGNAVARGEEFKFTKRLVRTDGTVVPVEAYGVPVITPEHETVQIMGVFRALPTPT